MTHTRLLEGMKLDNNKRDQDHQKKKTGILHLIRDATLENLSTSSSAMTYFFCAISQSIPHVRSIHPLGHLIFSEKMAKKLIDVAQNGSADKTSHGVATFWAGPSFPVFYLASNDAKHAFVRESHIGVIDGPSWDYIKTLSGGNNVMSTFPAFRPVDSKTYRAQRAFLLQRFHGGAKQRLPKIAEVTTTFLDQYCKTNSGPVSLREFITLLVLHTSSHLLGLSQTTLDKLYCEHEKFREAIGRVAKYGVSEQADPVLEEVLYQFFLCTFQSNFEQISEEGPETNLIRNIFASINVEFPKKFSDFHQLTKETRHTIAMNFASTGLGAMVHSTANSLDWAIARLLKEKNKLDEFVQLMVQHKGLDLTEEGIFDKEKGPLFPLCTWVLHNVFLYPTFSHEFFLNHKSSNVTLADKSTLSVPSKSFILVNYAECNRSDTKMTMAETFPDALAKQDTTGRFIMDKRVASFGGSKISRDNPWTRICPGAKTSLLEQMIMIAIIIRDYSLQLTGHKEISCAVDPKAHPLCSRVNTGNIILTPKLSADANIQAEQNDTSMKNFNRFFNRFQFAAPYCNVRTAEKILRTGITIGTAIALHTMMP